MGQAAYDMTEVRRRRAPQTQRKVPLRVEKGGKPRLNPVRAAMQHALQLVGAALLGGASGGLCGQLAVERVAVGGAEQPDPERQG